MRDFGQWPQTDGRDIQSILCERAKLAYDMMHDDDTGRLTLFSD